MMRALCIQPKEAAVPQTFNVLVGVIAVTVAVPLGRRESTPLLTTSEPVGRELQFAGNFAYRVGGGRLHASTIGGL
jgi:hypothetical protein